MGLRDDKGQFVGGSGNPAGRPKGAKNKFTNLKTSFINVYSRLGGDDALLEYAKEHPTEYYRMLHTMLPKEIQAEVRNDIMLTWGTRPGLPDPNVIEAEVIPAPGATAVPANSNKVSDNGKDNGEG